MAKRFGILAIAVLVVALILARLPTVSPGFPDPTAAATPAPIVDSNNAAGTDPITWDQASQHLGEHQTICGPVVSTAYRTDVGGSPTWLNVGRDHPDTSRFQVIIWGDDRGNFPQPPEEHYRGQTICVTGRIESYEGIAEMVIASPASISVQ